MKTFSRMLEVLFQQNQGGILLSWAVGLTEGRRMLLQTGNYSQLQPGGLSRRWPCRSTGAATGRLAESRSGAAVLTGRPC